MAFLLRRRRHFLCYSSSKCFCVQQRIHHHFPLQPQPLQRCHIFHPNIMPPIGNVLPLLADGQFEVGCADIMTSPAQLQLAERTGDAAPVDGQQRDDDAVGVFARIFYPTSSSSTTNTASTTDDSQPPPPQPAASTTEQRYMRWRPDAEYMEGLAAYQNMSLPKINFFLDWIVGDKKTPVQWHAPIMPGPQRFPLIIFSHGISGNRFVYTTLCASMASHGYVVAAMEHRDGSCCWTYSLEPAPAVTSPAAAASASVDEQQQKPPTVPAAFVKKPLQMRILPHDETEYEIRIDQVKKRVAETVQMRRIFAKMDANGLQNDDDEFERGHIVLGEDFDWAQFKCRLALDYCVCMGHSFGAASALASCAEHQHLFSACVLLDAWLYPVERRLYRAVVQPVLLLNANRWQWARNVRRMQRLLMTTNDNTTATTTAQEEDGTASKATKSVAANSDTRMMFTLKDIVHQSFSDFGFLTPGRLGRYFVLQGDLDPTLTGTAIVEMVLLFLAHQRKQQRRQQRQNSNSDEEEEAERAQQNAAGQDGTDNNSNDGTALECLRRLVADKYETFVLDGTDITQVQLDEATSAVEAEQVAEEERRVANDGSVETTEEMKTTNEQQQNGM